MVGGGAGGRVFTGLIEDLGSVTAVREDGDGATIEVATALAPQIGEGDSVAVNGVCLTATGVTPTGFGAQAMRETLRRSSLGDLQAGSPVNVELALRADARLGGHVVQGHVDGTATVTGVRPDGFARVLDLEIDARAGERGGLAGEREGFARGDGGLAGERGFAGEGGFARGGEFARGGGFARERGGLSRYLVEKGSVALDGVSLTVSELRENGFSVSLIPETLQRTNLGSVRVGDRVNIEVDVLAKHVERLMRPVSA